MKINTVLGPMDTRDMGVTLMHEHIATVDWNFARAFAGFYDREETVRLFCEEMEKLKPYGLKTFVDATPITLGRDITVLRECMERSGINIIACTGLYWQEWPNYEYGADPRFLADMLIQEIEHGIEGTDSKPAFLKCATQIETENNKTMLQGIALASKETGLPIMAHANPSAPAGRFQKPIFAEMGIDPKKIAYCHIFNQRNRQYILDLAEGGSFVGCDQLVYLPEQAMAKVADLTAEMMKTDVLRQIYFSCDCAIHSDYGAVLRPSRRDREHSALVLKEGVKKSLFDTFLPMLRERGITDGEIREVMELNPRRFFGEEI